MSKPVLLAVDDDPDVLSSVVHDLRRQYSGRYRVLQADDAANALAALEQLRLREQPVALLLVDQRMPRMSGVELLERTAALYPDAKRVLLTAYADTGAAIDAINHAHTDYYLLKPWDPPEQGLYPVLDDLLEAWQSSYVPVFEGIRVVGHRWSNQSHQLREFLARNQIPYRWLDVEAGTEGLELLERVGADPRRLPVVLLPDGSHLVQPTQAEVAARAGLRVRAGKPFYDLVIVGAGPAGLAAAVYGASEGLLTVLIESQAPGGQAGTSSRIENYLGFPAGLSGSDLARRAVAQARRFGAEILAPQNATALRVEGPYRRVVLSDGAEVACHTLLIATGVAYRTLELPGVEALNGAGVFYGATLTEAASFRGEDVLVVGAGNSAGQAAVHLASFARGVTLLVRGDDLRKSMSSYLVDQIAEMPNVGVRLHSVVTAVRGSDHLEAVTVEDRSCGTSETLDAAALFVFIGAAPHTGWLGDVLARDERGFILTGPDLRDSRLRANAWPLRREPYLLETSVPGVFAAGDVRHGSVKRVASGVGEGAIAVSFVHRYLADR